jgi:hypothetical protein
VLIPYSYIYRAAADLDGLGAREPKKWIK